MGLYQQALSALQTSDPTAKMMATRTLAQDWRTSKLWGQHVTEVPLTPSRPEKPKLVSPGDVARRRLGTVEGRCALLHAVAHIEFNAIDLALDMICRFGSDPLINDSQRSEFMDDWVSVADDEARHYGLISERLKALGYTYGDFPAHNGLWEAAMATRHDISARLAVAPMVLEARGLDVTPGMIHKLKSAGDAQSAQILHIIYTDEIGHVAIGTKWFHVMSKRQGKAPEDYFKQLVKSHFKGHLKPPFNHEARRLAGVPKRYYAQ